LYAFDASQTRRDLIDRDLDLPAFFKPVGAAYPWYVHLLQPPCYYFLMFDLPHLVFSPLTYYVPRASSPRRRRTTTPTNASR